MIEESHVVIIGAGPSGLAVGACLRERGIPFVLLEQSDAVGATWRRHYQRLHLHTVKQFSSLPGLAWPRYAPPYPSRAQMVDYLQRYAERFRLEPRFGAEVVRAHRDGSRWVTQTRAGEFTSRALVVATGYSRLPNVPTWPGQERFRGPILHSSTYGSGAAFRGQRVLVVGSGNSGGEIAMDLWEHAAETTVSARSGIHVIPRDPLRLPAQFSALALYGALPVAVGDRLATAFLSRTVGDLSRWGIHRPEIGPGTRAVKEGRIPLIDMGTLALIQQGKIAVVPGPRAFTETGVIFTDGRELPFDAVVLATGYRAGLGDFLEDAARFTDERGYPRWHGAPTPTPGLFFIGFRNPITGQLRDIAAEAPRVARHLRGVN
ncbi:flavin-containing monooxygenase [Sorangium sp. So ce176]|uniref:flavin-containing monooxygenase n=1 Tax=Sorangium sp. So ce176 TaxID=3133286 RepID=UPI003F60C38C